MAFAPWRSSRGLLRAAAYAAAIVSAAGVDAAHAQQKLEVDYRATLSGLSIGTGTLTITFDRDRYSMTGSGRAGGLMQAISGGSGEGSAEGAIAGKHLSPATYAHAIRSNGKVKEVRMSLAGGAVKQLTVEPPPEPDAEQVPLTPAHKRGVVDPLSAGIIAAAGAGGVGAQACDHAMPIFDGRLRFNLKLAYKRRENVRTRGYDGPAVVCRVTFEPLGGHPKDKFAFKFLSENRDMEIWFAPVSGTPFLTFIHIFVPTPLGPGVLEATKFAVTGASRAGTGARVQ